MRGDLPPGLQIAQAVHAARQFVEHFPDLDRAWFVGSNNVAVLQAPSSRALQALVDRGGAVAPFHEPDLGGELTAAAFCGEGAASLLGALPLALRSRRSA